MKNKLMKLKVALLLCLSSSLSYSQIVINTDIANASGEFSVVTLKSGSLAPTTAVVDFFWFGSGDFSTISGWKSASDWTSSSLYSNKLGSLTMGAGYSGTGLFSGPVEPGAVSASAIGKFLAAAITSGSELGVFRGTQTVPSNTPAPSPATPVNYYLADVNSGGVMVGSFSILPNVTVMGDVPLENVEAYALIPEPSSASLLALGVAGLVALRIRRKS